ncbi:MAG: chemotaxis protein CheA [Desulfobacterales bacterium]|nr:chemotaxis protein CheA [Desulfobacterales bacterium]
MKELLENVTQLIDSLALETVMLDPGDIPGLGAALKSLESIDDLAKKLNEQPLISLTLGMRGYLEKVILCEASDLSPLEAGVSELQTLCRDLVSGKKADKDISPLLKSLGYRVQGSEESKTTDSTDEGSQSGGENGTSVITSDEDKEIIIDFANESLDNLGTIEVKLMDLEQDPSDVETINAIFRPFHTVKGVSGFLNFTKINKLAHISENLLDKARTGELSIDGEVVDIILESVDMLKGMIESVQASLDTGTPLEGDMDTEQIIVKIENFLTKTEGGSDKPLGEILVKKGAISESSLKEALDIQKEQDGKKIGEILVEQKKVKTKEVVSALRKQKGVGRPATLHVKVDTAKLDGMVDMVGELAIAQSMLRQNELITASRDRKLDQTVNQLNLITSGLQKTAMSLRMEPIKNSFQKMLRLVRDLSRKAGKETQLVMSGEDTEIDRNMVEEIYEPMVHMIRNSIDHGMELPAEREAANKPRQGTVYLRAYHKGGDIVIEIEDDGRGLNREKILEKARSSGLVKEDEKLTDGQIDNLIFHAGLSTAEKITDISGRGVGMDVVKSRIIEKLRGRVDVQSTPGKGSTVFIRLPLTLAIIDGMIVKVSGERYVIPTLAIQESFRPEKAECHTVSGEAEVIMFRNHLVPLIRLNRLFGLNGNSSSNGGNSPVWEKLVVVVENQEKKRCVLVDELLGQEEIVIKSLGGRLKNTKGIAGAAIMGDGAVGLILDISGIFSMFSEGL